MLFRVLSDYSLNEKCQFYQCLPSLSMFAHLKSFLIFIRISLQDNKECNILLTNCFCVCLFWCHFLLIFSSKTGDHEDMKGKKIMTHLKLILLLLYDQIKISKNTYIGQVPENVFHPTPL